jgi:hypothetical protein
LLGAATAFRAVTTGTLTGGATIVRSARDGGLSPGERVDVDRAVGRITDRAGLDQGFDSGLRAPADVVARFRAESALTLS